MQGLFGGHGKEARPSHGGLLVMPFHPAVPTGTSIGRRAFSAAAAKEHGLFAEPRRPDTRGSTAYSLGSKLFEDGYEVKAFALSSLSVEAKPPLEEVQAFNQVHWGFHCLTLPSQCAGERGMQRLKNVESWRHGKS
jgi:hypothetical protein